MANYFQLELHFLLAVKANGKSFVQELSATYRHETSYQIEAGMEGAKLYLKSANPRLSGSCFPYQRHSLLGTLPSEACAGLAFTVTRKAELAYRRPSEKLHP